MGLTSLSNIYGETVTKFMSECSLENFANFGLLYSYNFCPNFTAMETRGTFVIALSSFVVNNSTLIRAHMS